MLLAARRRYDELMDQPALDTHAHLRALAGLRRINRASRTGPVLWKQVRAVAGRRRALRVLDVACGGGDLAVWLMRRARRSGIRLQVDGCDISPVAVNAARRLAVSTGCSESAFFEFDAVRDSLPRTYDVVISTLFLHHLDEDAAIAFLRSACNSASVLLLVDDLRRTALGYALAWVGCRILSRSPIVHFDGPASVRGAFNITEVSEFARRAGLENAHITRHWPQRFLLSWQPT